jgi:hypothetical protein
MTNSRLISSDQGNITFRYKDSQEHCWKIMTLDASEFIRRFLQHVLPKGFHKVRYYGLLSPRNRQRLDHIRRQLTIHTIRAPKEKALQPEKGSQPFLLCPDCQIGSLIPIMVIPPKWRAPP